jgi:hypothetical protein
VHRRVLLIPVDPLSPRLAIIHWCALGSIDNIDYIDLRGVMWFSKDHNGTQLVYEGTPGTPRRSQDPTPGISPFGPYGGPPEALRPHLVDVQWYTIGRGPSGLRPSGRGFAPALPLRGRGREHPRIRPSLRSGLYHRPQLGWGSSRLRRSALGLRPRRSPFGVAADRYLELWTAFDFRGFLMSTV